MTFGIPFGTDILADGFVTIQQGGTTVVEKALSACECGDNTVSAKLTQEESLSLRTGNVEIRLVVKTMGGDRLETKPIIERVAETSKDGVI